MKLNKCIEKVCCFYASDWHLTVMLLPYINKNIDEKNKIYMKFEHSIEDKMKILLGKLQIKLNRCFLRETESFKWFHTVELVQILLTLSS